MNEYEYGKKKKSERIRHDQQSSALKLISCLMAAPAATVSH